MCIYKYNRVGMYVHIVYVYLYILYIHIDRYILFIYFILRRVLRVPAGSANNVVKAIALLDKLLQNKSKINLMDKRDQ